jgi:hypothetical protein
MAIFDFAARARLAGVSRPKASCAGSMRRTAVLPETGAHGHRARGAAGHGLVVAIDEPLSASGGRRLDVPNRWS